MSLQKNCSLKYCSKCQNQLTDENWAKWAQKRGSYVCTPCRRIQEKKRYSADKDYSKKQRIRYHSRRSAVIFHYGNECSKCGEDSYEKLTIDGDRTYEWLYNNVLDKESYQVLCYNCYNTKNVIYKDKYALRDKKKVIEHYGCQCAECGEDRTERLTIEGKIDYTGVQMYRWLIKHNYPKKMDVQILCWNCSYSKWFHNEKLVNLSPESEHEMHQY